MNSRDVVARVPKSFKRKIVIDNLSIDGDFNISETRQRHLFLKSSLYQILFSHFMVSMFAESLDDEGEKESNNSETTERVESRACCLHDAQQTLSSFQV